jgi:hypothetical protein
MAVLAVAVPSLAGAVAAGAVGSKAMVRQTTAFNLARSGMEYVKEYPFTEPPSYPSMPAPEGYTIEAAGETVVDGYLQKITITVTYGERAIALEGYKSNRVPGVAEPGGS